VKQPNKSNTFPQKQYKMCMSCSQELRSLCLPAMQKASARF